MTDFPHYSYEIYRGGSDGKWYAWSQDGPTTIGPYDTEHEIRVELEIHLWLKEKVA